MGSISACPRGTQLCYIHLDAAIRAWFNREDALDLLDRNSSKLIGWLVVHELDGSVSSEFVFYGPAAQVDMAIDLIEKRVAEVFNEFMSTFVEGDQIARSHDLAPQMV